MTLYIKPQMAVNLYLSFPHKILRADLRGTPCIYVVFVLLYVYSISKSWCGKGLISSDISVTHGCGSLCGSMSWLNSGGVGVSNERALIPGWIMYALDMFVASVDIVDNVPRNY